MTDERSRVSDRAGTAARRCGLRGGHRTVDGTGREVHRGRQPGARSTGPGARVRGGCAAPPHPGPGWLVPGLLRPVGPAGVHRPMHASPVGCGGSRGIRRGAAGGRASRFNGLTTTGGRAVRCCGSHGHAHRITGNGRRLGRTDRKGRDVDLLTREWDLMELPGGEILTVVGTYRSTRARGQLTYVPDDDGGLEIFGRRYRKTSFEIWGEIPYGKQVLALPGES